MNTPRILAAVSFALLLGSAPVLAAESTTGSSSGTTGGTAVQQNTTGGGAAASSGGNDNGMSALGVDISSAGTTAADQKKFFQSQSADQQAQIRQRCSSLNTTGSVGSSDTSAAGTAAGSGSKSDTAAGSASTMGANVTTFCDNIRQ